jgi:DNA-binding CsgD family transcriptional regulator
MVGTLSERDLRSLMAVVEDGRRDDPNHAMPWATLEGLHRLIPCDTVVFNELDVPRCGITAFQAIDYGERLLTFDGQGDPNEPFWALRHDFLPCTYLERGENLTEVVRWSDFYTLRELHKNPMFVEDFGPDGCKHSMLASMPTAPGHTRRILLYRDSGSDFTERDRLVLQLLRPHLYETYLDAQRRQNGVPSLSRRELEVLRLAAEGRSNAAIARELFISIGTVRKHMEHVFDRTGARSRAGAAALVLPHLSVTEPH